MDRTAWIVVILCAIGLVAWEWWIVKQTPRRPAPAALSSTATPSAVTNASATPLVSPSSAVLAAAPTATPAAEAAPAFAEKIETLRNDDVELRLTNRGGGIREATLLNQIGQGDQRVVINSKDHLP